MIVRIYVFTITRYMVIVCALLLVGLELEICERVR